MSFPWLDRTSPRTGGADRAAEVAAAELASRAGLYYRLGYTVKDATQRLISRVAWEYETARPAALSDAAIGKIVTDTYARRPG
jgi:hypothetical protein